MCVCVCVCVCLSVCLCVYEEGGDWEGSLLLGAIPKFLEEAPELFSMAYLDFMCGNTFKEAVFLSLWLRARLKIQGSHRRDFKKFLTRECYNRCFFCN